MLYHYDKTTNKGNMCDMELDQPLSSPRLCHRAFDESTFLSPLSVETDITSTGKFNATNRCICHHGKDGCSVVRAHGLDIARHVHFSQQDGSGFRMLVSSVTYIRIYAEGK